MPHRADSSSKKALLTVLMAASFIVVAGSLFASWRTEKVRLPRAAIVPAEIDSLEEGTFAFSQTFKVHGKPEAIYDALTGDITGWWDHSVSGHPSKMFIEARPGGGFFEMIGNKGDGIRHAVVTYADRGHRFTMDGPLPFSGHPIDMLTTYTFEPDGDSTEVVLTVRAAGEIQSQWPTRIERNWRHFIYERFIPYWNAKEHHLNAVASSHAP